MEARVALVTRDKTLNLPEPWLPSLPSWGQDRTRWARRIVGPQIHFYYYYFSPQPEQLIQWAREGGATAFPRRICW